MREIVTLDLTSKQKREGKKGKGEPYWVFLECFYYCCRAQG